LRKIASLVLAAALLASLAACTATTPTAQGAAKIDGCTPTQPGKVSNAIKVTGKYGKEPTVKIKSPIATPKTTQRTVISLGKGKDDHKVRRRDCPAGRRPDAGAPWPRQDA
jgi:peptidylprolyl isomerase